MVRKITLLNTNEREGCMSRAFGTRIATTAIVAAWLTAPATAQTKLEVVAFEGTTNLPLWVAMDRGFLAKEGIEINLSATKGAIPQMQDTMAGKYHIASTAMDNLAGFAEGQVEVAPPPGFDVVALAGVHSGTNYVVARPEIKTFADIKGKTVSVDAIQSGYGFVLYRLLEDNGLRFNVDYKIIAVGSGPARLESMKAGTSVAAVLAAPNDIEARKLGYTVLADTVEALRAYQATTYAARRSWAQAHPQETTSFLRGMINAMDYLFADKRGSIAVLQKYARGIGAPQAEAIYNGLTSGKGGFNRKLAMNMDGVRMVLDLRSRYAEPKMALTDPNTYIDLSYYDDAMRALR
jgi:ABC-type nitrate/sulfonate/bicarbonate transport system substrate-binding protein